MSKQTHLLLPHHHAHLSALGIPWLRPPYLRCDKEEYARAYKEWRKTHPHQSHEFIHTKALGHIAWAQHSREQSEKRAVSNHDREIKFLKWIVGFLVLALLLAIARPAHAQFSHITSIDFRNNDNSAQGFFTSPFVFKAGSNCSFAPSGTTQIFNCSGGAAAAGGSPSQVQYNNASALGGISTMTSDGTIVTAKVGTNWLFVDPTDTSKKFSFDASNIATSTTRTVNIPNANSTTAQALSAVANTYVSGMSAQGVFSTASIPVTSVASRTGAVTLTSTDVGLANVTNDAQTKAAIVPNTAPSAGQLLVGNAGGTAYAPVSSSGDATAVSSGAFTVAKVNGISYSATAAAHTVEVITTANTTATAKVIPDCTDSTGNHLNYTQSTDSFSCGTTDSHVGTVTSVSGTANEITSSGGATPTLSVASTFDIHGKTSTAPVKAGTIVAAPATCQASIELYIETDATAGQQLFICNAAGNGWVLVGDGGGAGGGASTADSFITISHDADLTGERTLAGTSGDVTVTDGGANASVTLDTGANIPKVTTSNTYSASTTQGFDAITASKENGICIIDGVKNTTLAAAITCAGTSGVIEVPPSAGTLSVPASATIPAGVTLQVDQGAILSIATTFTLTINGPITAAHGAAIFAYVGTGVVALGNGAVASGVDVTWFPGSDIGAQINAAYTACPANGCQLLVPQPPSSNSYNYSTPILFTTSGKFPILQGLGGGSSTILLNYTPTTATTALTMDYVPAGGSDEAPGGGIRDLTLINNSCGTGGGCGSSAKGLVFANTNLGAHKATFSNMRVEGFSTAIENDNANSWGIQYVNVTVANNLTGLNSTVAAENTTFIGGSFAGNGTHINWASGDLYLNNMSIDQHTGTNGIVQTGGTLVCTGCHFEDSASLNCQFINASGVGTQTQIIGGWATDDATSGTASAYYFQSSGYAFYVSGLYVTSSGRSATTIFNAGANVRGVVQFINGSGGQLPTHVAGTSAAKVTDLSFWVLNSNVTPAWKMEMGLKLGASLASQASLNIPSGTAPTSPVAGDIWQDTNEEKHVVQTATSGAIKLYDSGGTNAITHTTSGTVTSYTVNHPLAAATGVLTGVNASNVITWSHSGDSAHSISQTAKTAAISTATLCAATANTACGQAGTYRVSWSFYGSGTACSSVTAGSVTFLLTFTDPNGVAHSAVALPMVVQNGAATTTTQASFPFQTALANESGSGDYTFSTNGAVIQYATGYTACTTGTGTYNLKASVFQIQ